MVPRLAPHVLGPQALGRELGFPDHRNYGAQGLIAVPSGQRHGNVVAVGPIGRVPLLHAAFIKILLQLVKEKNGLMVVAKIAPHDVVCDVLGCVQLEQ